jgi:hypothetical protein
VNAADKDQAGIGRRRRRCQRASAWRISFSRTIKR